MQARADFEALLGQRNGGLQQAGPRQLAVLTVGQLQHAHCAGGAHGAPAHHRIVEGHGLAIGFQKQVFGCGGGGGFPPVIGFDLVAGGVQQEGSAADTAGLGLDQTQYHLHGDGGVNGATARFEYLVARIGGQGVGGSHSKFFGGPARFFGVAGAAFRLRGHLVVQVLGGRAASGQQGGRNDNAQHRGWAQRKGEAGESSVWHGAWLLRS